MLAELPNEGTFALEDIIPEGAEGVEDVFALLDGEPRPRDVEEWRRLIQRAIDLELYTPVGIWRYKRLTRSEELMKEKAAQARADRYAEAIALLTDGWKIDIAMQAVHEAAQIAGWPTPEKMVKAVKRALSEGLSFRTRAFVRRVGLLASPFPKCEIVRRRGVDEVENPFDEP